MSVDERLSRYRSKRDFSATSEPEGRAEAALDAASGSARFVVHRHRASSLHYDLRLEIGGVLVSWAVPKGPTLDPSARRLAVHVEDHPSDYFDFEGVIERDLYGAGDVIVWDWGRWEPHPPDIDPIQAVEDGELHFDLHGEKLRGRFALHRSRADDEDRWMLVHKHDADAREGWDPEDHVISVRSGRTNEEVALAPRTEWLPPTEAELEALDELGGGGAWSVNGDVLKLSNLDKVLFPGRPGEPDVTKRELIRYYACVSPHLLPYVHDRPVNRHRFPDGVERPGFWEKSLPRNAPPWMTSYHDDQAAPGRTEHYVVIDRTASLVFMANEASLELHPWTSSASDVSRPTWALIDIDPGEASDFDDVLTLARLHRVALDQLGLRAMPKVTGKRGVQIWLPIFPTITFDETRSWVEGLSRAIGEVVPDLVSWSWHKKDRRGLARLDYTQNSLSHTLVAPFSVRPAPGAPVSVPINWDELDDPDLEPDRWTIRDVLDRLARVGDPLRPLIGLPQVLPPVGAGGSSPTRRSSDRSAPGSTSRARSSTEPVPSTPRRTKAELYDDAKRHGITGRSKMTRAELEAALENQR